MKKNLWLILGLIFMLVLAGCSPPVEETAAEEPMLEAEEAMEEEMEEAAEEMTEDTDEAVMPEMLEMTYDELSKYTGQDGMAAYVAVDGVIYDVTDVPAWKGGKHNGNMAGMDVTDAIKNKSPHGLKTLEGLAIVGKIKEEMDSEEAMMPEMLEMTYEELSKYTGQDGMAAYVAVDGVIYDVTDVPAWTGGKHNGSMAGMDVTDAIKNKSPHGVKKLEGLPVVGKIVE